MNDIVRARLVDALQERGYFSATDRKSAAEGIVDLLLSLPGIAIVEIPEPLPGRVAGELPGWEVGPTVVQVDSYGRVLVDGSMFETSEARALAARLLAAANVAERAVQ